MPFTSNPHTQGHEVKYREYLAYCRQSSHTASGKKPALVHYLRTQMHEGWGVDCSAGPMGLHWLPWDACLGYLVIWSSGSTGTQPEVVAGPIWQVMPPAQIRARSVPYRLKGGFRMVIQPPFFFEARQQQRLYPMALVLCIFISLQLVVCGGVLWEGGRVYRVK